VVFEEVSLTGVDPDRDVDGKATELPVPALRADYLCIGLTLEAEHILKHGPRRLAHLRRRRSTARPAERVRRTFTVAA